MNADVRQISPYAVFALLNLELPALALVKNALSQARQDDALTELHRYLTRRSTPGWRIEGNRKQQLIDYVQRYCAGEREAVMKTADEVVEQTFLFRFPWDMERSRIPVTFEEEIDWRHVPDKDVEWAYMLNRHRYWVALGQAYTITGKEDYARAFCCQLEDWIDRNPVPDKPTNDTLTWRTIEVGLRCANWIKALSYIQDSPLLTPALLAKVMVSLYEHGQYLALSFTGWKKISNWGCWRLVVCSKLRSTSLSSLAPKTGDNSVRRDWERQLEFRLWRTASTGSNRPPITMRFWYVFSTASV